MTPLPGAAANDMTKGAQGVRDKSAASAPPRGKRPTESEFGAMLLLAGIADVSVSTSPQGGQTGQAAGDARSDGTRPARLDRSNKHATKAAEPKTVASLAAEALSRSQADELRTIGKGVSLSALAQAELRGDAGPAARSPGPRGEHAAAGNQASSHVDASERTENAQGRAPDKAAANPAMTAPGATLDAGRRAQATTARAGQSTATNALRALDRLASAASRAPGVQALRGPSASAAPALPGGVTAAAKSTMAKPSDASLTPGGPAALAKGVGLPAAEARPDATRSLHASKAREAPRPNPASQARFNAQVHRALGQALQARDGAMTIHLTPEHLGHLRVDLSRGEDGVSARFEAQTVKARGLLERSLPELKAALEARGLHVDRLDVRLTEPPAAERAGHEGEPAAEDAGDAPGQDGRPSESGGSPDQNRGSPEPAREGRRHRDRPGAAGRSPRAEPDATPNHAAEPAWGVSTIEFVA